MAAADSEGVAARPSGLGSRQVPRFVEELQDMRELRDMISKHLKYTGSQRAKTILDSWEVYLPKFIKVIPYEYKRVLEEEKLEALRKKIEAVETDVENQETSIY